MRRPSREINIFSVSALDLFASALGVFILLTIVLFPYYLKVDPELIEENRALREQLAATQQSLESCEAEQASLATELEATQQALQTCEAENEQLNQQLAQERAENQGLQEQLARCQRQLTEVESEARSCQEKLQHTFLAVVIKWSTHSQDIDLHVFDTQGQEFYFSKNNRDRQDYPNSQAELSVDTTDGPGIEIWENPRAKAGHYKVYLNLYSRNGNNDNPVVQTTAYYRDGSKKLPDKRLTQEGQKVLVATIQVMDNGDVEIR